MARSSVKGQALLKGSIIKSNNYKHRTREKGLERGLDLNDRDQRFA